MDFFDGKESPPSSMFFCLGEKWPDPENKPWEKKLIMVEVKERFYFKWLAVPEWKKEKTECKYFQLSWLCEFDSCLFFSQVVPTSMELLKNAAVECGASSLRSVELQMSLEEMMDLYWWVFFPSFNVRTSQFIMFFIRYQTDPAEIITTLSRWDGTKAQDYKYVCFSPLSLYFDTQNA